MLKAGFLSYSRIGGCGGGVFLVLMCVLICLGFLLLFFSSCFLRLYANRLVMAVIFFRLLFSHGRQFKNPNAKKYSEQRNYSSFLNIRFFSLLHTPCQDSNTIE